MARRSSLDALVVLAVLVLAAVVGLPGGLTSKMRIDFEDIASLTPEERQAVEGLAAAGIIGNYGGRFRGNAYLTQPAEQEILLRVRQAIKDGPH